MSVKTTKGEAMTRQKLKELLKQTAEECGFKIKRLEVEEEGEPSAPKEEVVIVPKDNTTMRLEATHTIKFQRSGDPFLRSLLLTFVLF